MKKRIIGLLMLLFIPTIIYGKCDSNKFIEIKESFSDVTYSKDYNTSSKKFSVIFENIDSDIYAKYNNVTYKPSNNEIIINNISEGSNITVYFYLNGCDTEIDIRKVTLPYYNTYYGSSLCVGYEEVLTMCNSKFTTVKVTKDVLELAIDNYNNMKIDNNKKEETVVEDKESFLEKVVNFSEKWGIRIAIFTITSVICIAIGSVIYRKEVHGV